MWLCVIPYLYMKLTNKQQCVANFLKDNKGQFTYNELEKETGVLRRTVLDIIHKLKVEDRIRPDIRQRLEVKPSQRTKQPKKKKPETKNILVIGDLHEPFCLDGYLDLAKETYEKYECTHTIFIGDVIDNHFASYHETDPDGFSAYDELDMAIHKISKWVEAFPVADVVIGNHDRLIARKALTGGISGLWLRQYNDVLNAPEWDFQEQFKYDGVKYIHGEGGTARTRMKKDLMPIVQGHLHTQSYVEHLVGDNFHIYGMQVGCGINRKAYSMAYGKNFSKPAIALGVVLDHGTLPINIMAKL